LKPQEFEVYSPKAIATRYELPFTVKCLRILTERAPKEYSQKRAQLPFDPQFKEIINLLVRATVKYWREIVQAYKSIQQTDKLTGRAFNYWAPILAVCKVFNPEGYNELLGLAEEYATSQKASDKLSEVEAAHNNNTSENPNRKSAKHCSLGSKLAHSKKRSPEPSHYTANLRNQSRRYIPDRLTESTGKSQTKRHNPSRRN